MNIKYFFILVIFLFTYMVNIISVLYTESIVLFLAVFFIFIVYINNINISNKKNDLRWNELVLFYFIFKNWNRALRRDTHIKMANFVSLAIQLQKYELLWIKRNINRLVNKDYKKIEEITNRRLELLSMYKKQMKFQIKTNGLRALPLGE